MQTNIRKWGNSQGLCIPRSMLQQLGWAVQDDVEISVQGNRIIIEKMRPRNAKEQAAVQIKTLRKPAGDFDAKAAVQDYLEERYED